MSALLCPMSRHDHAGYFSIVTISISYSAFFTFSHLKLAFPTAKELLSFLLSKTYKTKLNRKLKCWRKKQNKTKWKLQEQRAGHHSLKFKVPY